MKKVSTLKNERELRGWSQERVAEELGVTSRTVARWEQGLAKPYPYYREKLIIWLLKFGNGCKSSPKKSSVLGLTARISES